MTTESMEMKVRLADALAALYDAAEAEQVAADEQVDAMQEMDLGYAARTAAYARYTIATARLGALGEVYDLATAAEVVP